MFVLCAGVCSDAKRAIARAFRVSEFEDAVLIREVFPLPGAFTTGKNGTAIIFDTDYPSV